MKIKGLSKTLTLYGISPFICKVMKVTLFLLTVFFLQLSAATKAQQITVNETGASLKSIFKLIKKQTGYTVLYQTAHIKNSSLVSLHLERVPLAEAMEQVLQGQGLSYVIKDKVIVIQESTKSNRRMVVTGRVVDEEGRALIGASVTIKGTGKKTTTDTKGVFELMDVNEGALVVISYVGYTTQEVEARSDMGTIMLKSTVGLLEDVIVTGYTSYAKSASANAATSVGAESINQVPGLTLDQILQGQVPGMTVLSSSGQPGQSASVTIRGVGSINGSTRPLYILDGVPIEGNYFQTINPEDIESATVLKDASAKALYGSRGSNGVVVLTTKKGKAGRIDVQYNSQYGLSTLSRPNFIMMNTEQRLRFEEEIGLETGRRLGPGWTYSSQHPDYINGTQSFRDRADAILDSLRHIDVDWRDMFFRDGQFMEQQLSISGGNDHVRFYNSLNYYKQDGVAKRTGMDRYALRSNVDFNSGKLTGSVQVSLGYSNSSFTEGEGGTGVGTSMASVYYALPYEYPYAPDGTLVHPGNRSDYFILDLREGSQGLERLLNSANKTDQFKTIVGTSLSYQLLPTVKISTRAGIDYRNSTDMLYINPDSYYGSRSNSTTLGGRGRFEEGARRNFSIVSTTGITYADRFADKHDVELSGFYEYIYDNYNSFGFVGFGLDERLPETPAAVTNGSSTYLPRVSGGKTKSALASFMGVARYTYDGKYTLNASYRYDGSTKVAPQNKWHGFYSVGANWDAKKESFLTDVDFLSSLNFRSSYGITASPIGSDFDYLATYSVGTSYGGVTGIRPSSPGNADYDWEYVNEFNVGMNLGLFRSNRLRLSVDYYNRTTSNMFFDQPLSATSGFSTLPLSSGKMRNKGVEFDVEGDVIQSSNWRWSLGVNAGYNENEILYLTPLADELLDGDTRIFKVGLPYGTYYAPDWAGVNPETGEAQYYNLDGSITTTYNATEQNNTNSGSLFPKFTGGFNTQVAYGPISLSALFSFVSGVSRWNNEDFYNENQRYATSNQSVRMLEDRWKEPGDIATLQRFDIPRNFTSKDIQDASFLRLRNVNLAYTLPTSLLQKIRYIRGAKLFVQGQNLLTWTSWRGLDPENSSVYGRFQYPNTRTFTAGLNINF